ncbi:MAG: rod shape-determining protein MreC [Blastocatellia bacterium]|nr:rod shape-determining protein MreC [Blastocatellia bacterium]MCS7156546.1 rod shape-determining protein MreC [Blastocatellia bacterium]MCX7751713.1 rod shape-determining protein MreC [Blastocatellia bacterium]MDW8168814.1 rod shape-determining protein MreC [Acidobacteriota bacterium]MDW8257472.1 rod shape-determining protein MreC [Acidobacteriota bacterium]
MGTPPRGRSVVIVFLALLSAQMLLMSAQARHPQSGESLLRVWSVTAAAPVLSSVHAVVSWAEHVWESYARVDEVQRENRALREEVAELRREVARFREEAREAERLRQLLELQRELPVRTIAARVIGRDTSVWFQSLIVNRGARHGVRSGAAVITPEGLVGRVIEVGPTVARVQLITDERSGVGAAIGILEETRAIGVVVGSNEALCRMRYVPGSEPVREGEMVYTTGQDGIYPRGLPIGRVIAVRRGSALVSHDILIEPAARLSRLEEVLILLERPSEVRVPTL